MPQLGEIRKGQDLSDYKGYKKRIWSACETCGRKRWVQLRYEDNTPVHKICRLCSARAIGRNRLGSNHPAWKGGRRWEHGYLGIRIDPDDFFRPMVTKSGYILEHRLVMARHLNRCLLPWEVVHHKNGIKDDNVLENLELLPTQKYHLVDTLIKSENKRLHKQVNQLKEEITLLRELLKK